MNVGNSPKKTLGLVAILGLVLVLAVAYYRANLPDRQHVKEGATASAPAASETRELGVSRDTRSPVAPSKKGPSPFQESVGRAIHGRVLDESGRPIRGASVQIQDSGEAGAVIRKADTDHMGAFRFLSLPDRPYALTVNLIGFVEYKTDKRIRALPEPSPSLTIVLRSGWTLTGKVVARNGKPVPRALIAVHEGTQGYHTYSRKDGSFEVSGIDSQVKKMQKATGIDTLKCTARGYAPAFLENVTPMGHVTVFLDEPGHLKIHLSISARRVREDMSWTVFHRLLAGPHASRNIGHTIRRGSSGSLTDLTPGTYAVTVTSTGYSKEIFKEVPVRRGETTRIDVSLTPEAEE